MDSFTKEQTANYRQYKRKLAIEMFGSEIGCSDRVCIFGHPGGMHTNGGCKCQLNAIKKEQAVLLLQAILVDEHE